MQTAGPDRVVKLWKSIAAARSNAMPVYPHARTLPQFIWWLAVRWVAKPRRPAASVVGAALAAAAPGGRTRPVRIDPVRLEAYVPLMGTQRPVTMCMTKAGAMDP